MSPMSSKLEVNKNDMHSIVKSFPQLLRHSSLDVRLREQLAEMRDDRPTGICFIGMGGSSIAGGYVATSLADTSRQPIAVVRDESLPEYIGQGYVSFVVSYSGNTQETLDAYEILAERGCHTVTMASGGLLSKKKADCFIRLPPGFPPRGALPAMFGALLQATQTILGVPTTDLNHMAEEINLAADSWGGNLSKPAALAEWMRGRIPVFMGSRHLYPVAYRAKCQMNENAKTEAFASPFPEATHNELEGFTEKRAGSFAIVLLKSRAEGATNAKRLDIVAEILSSAGHDCTIVTASAPTQMGEMLELTYHLDLTSVELADINGVDPLSVPKISALKKRLK